MEECSTCSRPEPRDLVVAEDPKGVMRPACADCRALWPAAREAFLERQAARARELAEREAFERQQREEMASREEREHLAEAAAQMLAAERIGALEKKIREVVNSVIDERFPTGISDVVPRAKVK